MKVSRASQDLSKAERQTCQAGLLQRAHEHPVRGLVRILARIRRRWIQHWRQFGQGLHYAQTRAHAVSQAGGIISQTVLSS